jgi:hypothetical protein
MELILDHLLWLIPAALLAFALRPFRRCATSVRFSPFAPVSPLMCLLLVLTGMEVQDWFQWRSGVPLLVFFGWATYASVMFGYFYNGTRFSWFNGLWRCSVSASSIRAIVWRRDKNRIAKVRFECHHGNINMRSDLKDAVTILKQMAKDHAIETKAERLPRWSI